jgi:hypothetical protein
VWLCLPLKDIFTHISSLQEAQSGVIEVRKFDSATVCRMLAYMYTGEYEDGKLYEAHTGAAIVKQSLTSKSINGFRPIQGTDLTEASALIHE